MIDKIIKPILFFYILSIHSISFCQETEKQLPTLRSGYYLNSFPDISIKDMEASLRFWTTETTKESGVNGETYVYSNLNKMRTDFYQGKLDFIVASPLVFVNDINLDVLVDGYKLATYGKSLDKLIVVTGIQSRLNHFKNLNHKRLAILSNDPVSQMFIDTLALEHFGKKAKQVFSTIHHIHQSSLLIYDLFFKKTDVILVYKEAYNLASELNPQIRAQTQIIAELDDIPRGISFFHRRVDPEFRELAISQALKMSDSPRQQQLLALFKSDKIERSTLDDLKTTQQLKLRYQRLIKKYRITK